MMRLRALLSSPWTPHTNIKMIQRLLIWIRAESYATYCAHALTGKWNFTMAIIDGFILQFFGWYSNRICRFNRRTIFQVSCDTVYAVVLFANQRNDFQYKTLNLVVLFLFSQIMSTRITSRSIKRIKAAEWRVNPLAVCRILHNTPMMWHVRLCVHKKKARKKNGMMMGFEGLDGAGWEVVIVGPQFDGRWWLRSLIKCYYSDNLRIWLNPRHYFNLNMI